MSILDYFTKDKEGKAKERVVKLYYQKKIIGLYLEKSMIASKIHLIYTQKLKREELRIKKKKR